MSPRPTAFESVRLLDPATGYDGPGAVLVVEGVIADVTRGGSLGSLSPDVERVDGAGLALMPGLVDLRVKTGEPGAEPKETLKSAARAAAAGGVTTIVVQPDTAPAIDDPAMVDFITRRARDLDLVHVRVAGAATRGCEGAQLAEIGLMREAGCAYVTDADRPIADSRVFRRVLTYARAFDAVVAHRPSDPSLTAGAVATDGEFAARLGMPAAPAIAERIMLERDLALAELTGARLLVDQITTGDACERLRGARARGVQAVATASINALSFNELDIGDYRTFYRLDPPLRAEADRAALLEAVASGLVEIVTSTHTPQPAEEKRLPFAEASPGAVGLETLLPALLTLHLDGQAPLMPLLKAVTSAPADLLGLACGRIAKGAPADLVLVDLEAPRLIDAARLRSKSKNSPFDGRRLQGEVRLTIVDGRVVFRAGGMIPWERLDSAPVADGDDDLRLMRRGTEFSIMAGAIELMNSRLSGSEEALATLACERLPAAPHVLIGGLGMGFTLRAALDRLGADARVTVVELIPAVIGWARGPLAEVFRGSLDDPRVRLVEDDVASMLREARAAYDAVLLDVDNGPKGLIRAANDALYDANGLGDARRALAPGGVLAVWSAAPDAAFARRLRDAGFAVRETPVRAHAGRRGARHVVWIAQAPGA